MLDKCYDFCASLLDKYYPHLNLQYVIEFNPRLRTTAGRAWNSVPKYRIELNARFIDELGFEAMKQTLAHELAHVICYALFGRKNIQPHGVEWQRVMNTMGFNPKRTHNLFEQHAMEPPATRRQRRWEYKCCCDTEHHVPTVTHNRMQKGILYMCNDCKQVLKFTGKEIV